MDMSLSKLQEFAMDREVWRASVHGVTKSGHNLSDWTELNCVIEWFALKTEIILSFSDCTQVLHYTQDHLSCFLINMYADQKAIIRTRHATVDWFQIGKGVCQSCILSPCLFNWYAEYIMWNVGLDEAQAGIKIAGRNINNLSYADETTLMAESEEGLKSLLMKVKEDSEKAGLKLNIQKTNIMASSPITSWQINGETMEAVRDFIYLFIFRCGAPKSLQMVTAAMKLKDACSLKEKLWQTWTAETWLCPQRSI